jgi:hypothetical protein
MLRARAPPWDRAPTEQLGHNHQPMKGTDMDNNDSISDFLAAVEDLRGEDETVRTTAHTSSVSADGWPTSDNSAA